MPLRKWAVFFLLVVVLAACGGSAAPTVGEAKDFATACDKANDGKRIAIVGFLRFPASFTGNQSMVLRFYQTADFSGKPIGVQTEIGSKANQVNRCPTNIRIKI